VIGAAVKVMRIATGEEELDHVKSAAAELGAREGSGGEDGSGEAG
jgi:hypothetical protein